MSISQVSSEIMARDWRRKAERVPKETNFAFVTSANVGTKRTIVVVDPSWPKFEPKMRKLRVTAVNTAAECAWRLDISRKLANSAHKLIRKKNRRNHAFNAILNQPKKKIMSKHSDLKRI
jgi:hypothetical protein